MSTLKRKRSRSPLPAPRVGDDVDYVEDGDEDVDLALATKVRAWVCEDMEVKYPCRRCGRHFDFLRQITTKDSTTWVCPECFEATWAAFQLKMNINYDDFWDEQWWSLFCVFIHERIRVRAEQACVKAIVRPEEA